MNQAELEEIRKRAEVATSGPWKWLDNGGLYSDGREKVIGDIAESQGNTWFDLFDTDAEFIAHAREDVPKLLAEIERLRRELSFITNVDLMKNAYNAEHIAVSVQTWALNVLDGVNHDGSNI